MLGKMFKLLFFHNAVQPSSKKDKKAAYKGVLVLGDLNRARVRLTPKVWFVRSWSDRSIPCPGAVHLTFPGLLGRGGPEYGPVGLGCGTDR